MAAPLVCWSELAVWEGHPLALTGWLEADQAEVTVLHRRPNGTFKATRQRFCASRRSPRAPSRASASKIKRRRRVIGKSNLLLQRYLCP